MGAVCMSVQSACEERCHRPTRSHKSGTYSAYVVELQQEFVFVEEGSVSFRGLGSQMGHGGVSQMHCLWCGFVWTSVHGSCRAPGQTSCRYRPAALCEATDRVSKWKRAGPCDGCKGSPPPPLTRARAMCSAQ